MPFTPACPSSELAYDTMPYPVSGSDWVVTHTLSTPLTWWTARHRSENSSQFPNRSPSRYTLRRAVIALFTCETT